MPPKPSILLIEPTVQAVDAKRRRLFAEKFHLLYYDCTDRNQFIQDLQPGGRYSHINGIIRNGWWKVGPYAQHLQFSTEVVHHFPPSLKIICSSGHGHDAADIEAITRRGIWFCNTPNACTEAVANTAVSLVLDTFRYLTFAQWCARYDWKMNNEIGNKAVDPLGHALGIVGLGDIGLAIAQKCEVAFGMDIHYQGPSRKPQAEQSLQKGAVYHSTVEDLIQRVDCIVLAAPYTPKTHHLLSRKQFSLAKSTGLRVVNIARGQMIDEEALIEAIDTGHVVGVGLDVHSNEPYVNEKLRENWRVTLLPHIGVCSRTSWVNFERINWDNIEAFFEHGKPVTPVNIVSEGAQIRGTKAEIL